MVTTKKIKDYPESLYYEGSPVVVNKMQLCYSMDYGVNVLEITFRNVSPLTMYGLSVIIETRDKFGNPTPEGSVEYNYYGIDVPNNRVFGGNEGIVMEQGAVEFTIRVIRADFADGVMFHGDIPLEVLPEPVEIYEMGDLLVPFKEEVARKKPKLALKYIPEKKPTYWRCTCGRVHPIDTIQCKSCYVDRDWITGIYPDLLDKEKKQKEALEERARYERELNARLKAEEEARIAEEERLRAEAERLKLQAAEIQRLEAEKVQVVVEEESESNKKKTIQFLIIAAVCVIVAVAAFFGMRLLMDSTKQRRAEEEASRQQAEIEAATATTAEPETEPITVVPVETESYAPVDININYSDPITIAGTSMAYLNYRSGPGLEYDVIGTLKPGDTFSILGQEGEWYYVDAQNTRGYVHESYVNVTVSVQS